MARDDQPDPSSVLGRLGGVVVASLNFEFLRRENVAVLADLCGFAEKYAHPDPPSAVVKLRLFAEGIVEYLYQKYRFPRPYEANLNDLMRSSVFEASVPNVVRMELHALRKSGNKGAHGNVVSTQEALAGLRNAFEVASWFFLSELGGSKAQLPEFKTPDGQPAGTSKGELKRQKKELLEKLRKQEDEMAKLLAQVAEERKKAQAAQEAIEQSEEQIAALRAKGDKAVSALELSEAETRQRLIDQQLVDAGWDVGANGKDTDEVGQEVKVDNLAEDLPKGRVDYVLWDDDGRPLGVVEAKRTAHDPNKGRKQAALYADALEKQFGQRPVIFYTNGVEIFIEDDAQGYPPRKIYGFYSKDSLQRLLFQRNEKDRLSDLGPSPDIAGRMYQVEAVKRVCERFAANHRQALIVQATGTGKTRVAISLTELLSRAKWAKRVLFLCDRKELRKQAMNAFKEHLPSEPRTIVSKATRADTKPRIFLGTYPAMMGVFETYDVGFFDLIIADESHRSIYRKYRELFQYFDCLQVGLTATPVGFVDRNTYDLFACEDRDPTFNYEFQDAIEHDPPYLVPFRVEKVSTHFQRSGLKYSDLSPEQRAELEAQVDDAEEIDVDAKDIDRQIFNKDTTRAVLRNLMEHGIKDADGALPGKTIIFARSHDHAMHLSRVFHEIYPHLGGKFCRVIDNHEKYAEQLIDNFKDPSNELTIAISVDMLDTGIDVPEIVNLVFAKPVRSYVKFWQMIGRGTRLCTDLFGPGQDKEEFLIFDHWNNFRFFDEEYTERQPTVTKSLMQHLFEARIELARAAVDQLEEGTFQSTIDLLRTHITDLLETKAIAVKDIWKELQQLQDRELLAGFDPKTVATLEKVAAPLMYLVQRRGEDAAYKFDLVMTRLQVAKLRESGEQDDLKARVEEGVEQLQKNLNPVKAKAESIKKVRSPAFWKDATVADLEKLRSDLRGIMKHRAKLTVPKTATPELDVRDSAVARESYRPKKLAGLELVEYRHRVKRALEEHFKDDVVLRKIRQNFRVSDDDILALAKLVLEVDPKADFSRLVESDDDVPEMKDRLQFVMRKLVGMDAKAIDGAFTDFVHDYPKLTAKQVQFLSMVKNHISQNGMLRIEDLYEAPFTQLHSEGVDGVFTHEEQVSRLLDIIANFDPSNIVSESTG